MDFEQRHDEVTKDPKLVGQALFEDWGFIGQMVESFKELRPQYAEYLDFEAANMIIKLDWTNLNTGVNTYQLGDWKEGVKLLEKIRLRDILPVTDCFMGLTASLLDTWKPDEHDMTKMRAEYRAKHKVSGILINDDPPRSQF
jgi:hypothetical protein